MEKQLPNELVMTCSQPILNNGNFQYVRSVKVGEITRKDTVIPVMDNEVCEKTDEGARLLKSPPTHVIHFKVVGQILFVAYAVPINDPHVRGVKDTFNKKKGKEICAARIAKIEKEYLTEGTTAEEFDDLHEFLPRVVANTFIHYMTIALYRLNIHGKVSLMVKGDSRDNSYHEIVFDACTSECSCKAGEKVDLGVAPELYA